MTAADHKRKSRPIAPSTITVTPAPPAITVVVPDVLGKNESHVAGQDGARHTSTATKRYRDSVRAGVVDLHTSAMFARLLTEQEPGPLIRAGAWRLEVLAVWPRERHTIKGRPVDFGVCPMGDADAAIPQALDALQHAGILDDDARVVEVRAWNLYRKDQRATIIRLSRVPDLAVRDEALSHLFRLAPPAPEEPAKPRTKAARRRAKETAT